MHIFLIRHGESIDNNKTNYEKRIPDHLVPLSDFGKKQSYETGIWLTEYCKNKNINLEKARIWRSPYLRTRQTSEEFNISLQISDIREDITLVEKQFGLLDSVSNPKDIKTLFPKEYDEYQRLKKTGGKFYARPPLGESSFDVAIRIHQFMDTIYRDYEKHGTDTLFVFTHGDTMKTFLLRWFHYSPEWFNSERTPKNCWIREIQDQKDCGYINSEESIQI